MSESKISSLDVRMTNAEQNIEKVFKRLSLLEKITYVFIGVALNATPLLLKLIS